MKLNDIETSRASWFVERPKDHCKIYKIDNIFYKFWSEPHAAYYVQDGLDHVYQGYKNLASITTGLITEKTCPAFKELIFDDQDQCCGYAMYEGIPLWPDEQYYKFIDYLVDVSIETGYGYRDLNPYNVVQYKDGFSVIDINFNPIKLNHGKKFDEVEFNTWIYTFSSEDPYYMDKTQTEIRCLSSGKVSMNDVLRIESMFVIYSLNAGNK